MTIKKRSLKIDGHTTSVSLEDEFWVALKSCAEEQSISVAQLVAQIDVSRSQEQGLSSALRVYILEYIQKSARKA
jgi:predicted DNA-binding ribbon-helix-helix protein